MKKRFVLIVSMFLVICSVLLILLTLLVEPISLKQAIFTFDIGDVIPTEVGAYANGSELILKNSTLDISNVDNTRIAIYDCSVTYKKKDYDFQIQIKDNNPPVAELIQVKWEIKVGDTLVASDMVTNIQETSNYTVYFDGDTPSTEMTFDSPGTFSDVYIYVEDEYGNKSDRLRVSVSVGSDQVAPVLSGVDDCCIYVGSYFDPLSGVTAVDNLDGNITSDIVVIGEVDTAVEGEYKVAYLIVDSAGNTTKIVRTVHVTSTYFDPTLIPDVGNHLFITKEQASTRYSYFSTIHKSVLKGKKNDEKVDAAIKYLIKNTVLVKKDDEQYSTSYSVIVDKMGNSLGEASAFKYMCDQLDVECYVVEGVNSYKGHYWNIVKYDGNYYHVDISALLKNDEKIFYSDVEIKQQGYQYDSSLYPKCNKKLESD